jgi:hypothetical protein
MRGLERRIRKLESVLPPLLTPYVSWMFAVLWFGIAHYLGNPSPDEKPFAAFARALGYANQSELESAMTDWAGDLAAAICSSISRPNQHGPDPLAKHKVRSRFGTVDRWRDLSHRLYKAEDRVCARFGIDASREYSDAKRFYEAFNRMEAGLSQSYKDQLKTVLTRENNLAWMRVHSEDVSSYLRCFA